MAFDPDFPQGGAPMDPAAMRAQLNVLKTLLDALETGKLSYTDFNTYYSTLIGLIAAKAEQTALDTAVAGSAPNTNAVATLDTAFTNDPLSLADGELLRDTINLLILNGRR